MKYVYTFINSQYNFLGTHEDNTKDPLKLTLFHRQHQIMSIHYRFNLFQFKIACTIPCKYVNGIEL